jgi:ribosomal protein S18 acetylase RimI-like enzyme
MSASTRIRESRPDEDPQIARHFYAMWRDNDVPVERIRVDWESRVLGYLAEARRTLHYRAFVAESDVAGIVGSAGCQIFAGLYPDVLEPSQRLYGYVWGVYVEPDHRRRGIARRLTQAATDCLASLGCSHALLHASPSGAPLYAGLGFEPTNEMRLRLRP